MAVRTQYLQKLDLPGREKALSLFPTFNFYNLSRITGLRWTADAEGSNTELIATIEYEDDSARKALVTLRFEGVALAILPTFRPNAFLSELEIEDVRERQLERVRYIAKDFDEVFEIHCHAIEITDCTQIE
ncbi:MAG TPA: hypothetical protein VM680_00645 [Verrucomicrobiae bacterium]|nr:hypothetical protein [Verrucomicrobiae bacterium]